MINKCNINKKQEKMELINNMVKEQLTCLIDKDLKTEFQIIAKRQDTTVTALITEFVTNYVNENK